DSLGQEADARIDLAQPALAVLIVGVLTAIAVAGGPRDDLGHRGTLPVQQELVLVLQALEPGRRDVVLGPWSRRLAHRFPERPLRSHPVAQRVPPLATSRR